MHRPPGNQIEFIEEFTSVADSVQNSKLYINDDFNLDLLKINQMEITNTSWSVISLQITLEVITHMGYYTGTFLINVLLSQLDWNWTIESGITKQFSKRIFLC